MITSKTDLLLRLSQVEQIAQMSKLKRMLANPLAYWFAIMHRRFVYPLSSKGIAVKTNTFFDLPMTIMLPAATDIFITKGKSDFSEIRLCKFLIKTLNSHDNFIDVGAHFGYFSLLASTLIGKTGKVIALEASSSNFKLLKENTQQHSNINALNMACGSSNSEIEFYEFETIYSEYNTTEISQFENKKWFKKSPPKKITVQSISIDELVKTHQTNPKVIKIDVEGAEFEVIKGTVGTLTHQKPIVVMEYLSSERQNHQHIKAVELLKQSGYKSYVININGDIEVCTDIEKHLHNNSIDSDNMVFVAN